MTHSIVNTEFDHAVSTHKTRENAERAYRKMCVVREWLDGRPIERETVASLNYYIRDDETGERIKSQNA